MRCYQCRSDVHSNCDEDLKESYLKECTTSTTLYNESNTRQIIEGDAVYCRKTVQKRKTPQHQLTKSNKTVSVHFLKKGKVITIRECAFIHGRQQCYEFLSSDVVVKTCDCEEEGCNVAGKLEGARNCVFLIVTLLVVRFFPP